MDIGDRNQELYVKRFFRRYENLLDKGLIRKDMNLYKDKLSKVSKMCKDIDFSNNVLILSKIDVSKEVFLNGFSKMEKYKTYKYYNIYELFEIFIGNYRNDALLESTDMVLNSAEIKQDVLCLTVNYYEPNNKMQEEVLVNTVMNRVRGNMSYKGARYNWIYSKSTIEELKAKYPKIWEVFNGSDPLFKVYDLNNSGVSISSGMSSSYEDDDIDSLY